MAGFPQKMEDWLKEWLTEIEMTLLQVDRFFQDMQQAIGVAVADLDATLETTLESAIAQLQRADEPDWLPPSEEREPLLMRLEDLELLEWPAAETPSHRACVGCRHYHGQYYGSNFLVCAMHPYGQGDDHCPDWEGYAHS
ncbi:MAG: hypothetical protein HC890_14940 [Chloroflexaceae bacterium]|nr:hypothetical protein [Chloroflexaceae bacterium]